MLVSADHSPESIREFERMRLTHPATVLPHLNATGKGLGTANSAGQGGSTKYRLPSLMVVYDSPSSNKLKCSPVFEVDHTGKPRVTGKGRCVEGVNLCDFSLDVDVYVYVCVYV